MNVSRLLFISSICLFISVALSSKLPAESKNFNYHLDPQAIIDQISKRGAAQVVRELYDDYEKWYSVLRKVASGNEAWLKVAVALRPGTDAGTTHMLKKTVGEALENAPENVLRIVPQSISLRSICGGPDIDDSRYDSYELSMKAINLRIEKVASVKNPALENTCKECIQYLEASKKGIARFYGVSTQ